MIKKMLDTANLEEVTMKTVLKDVRKFIDFHMLSSPSSYEPPRGKTNNVVSEQVRHKAACTSTGKS